MVDISWFRTSNCVNVQEYLIEERAFFFFFFMVLINVLISILNLQFHPLYIVMEGEGESVI